LNLRKDLASKSPTVGTAKHGDKLEVIETRRKFVRVRTTQGVEGWTDTNLLLTQQQMDDLHHLADSVAKLPSQGVATVLDALNMHAEPSRQAPSFYQIPEAGAVDVIGHRVAPRYPPAAAAPVHRAIPAAPAAKKSKAKPKSSTPPPPLPLPPAPPKNWEQLSRPRSPDLPGYIPPAARVNSTALDDWSLVRMREQHADAKTDPKVGWVLSRMLLMSIPDEVAQYAEGHRITSYASLGEIRDKEKNEAKPNWLWTTATAGQLPYEFDSFRVFVWSTRRHRYETAYIERNVKGYYPVETQTVPGQDEKAFSLVLQDKDGKLYKRTYAFSGYRVRMVSKTPYQPAPALPEVRGVKSFDPDPVTQPAESTWGEKFKEYRKRWFGK
jgi:Bacterial SH3 domain